MRKPAFCIYTFIIRNFKPLAVICGCTARFVWDLVGNPEDLFSHNEAHTSMTKYITVTYIYFGTKCLFIVTHSFKELCSYMYMYRIVLKITVKSVYLKITVKSVYLMMISILHTFELRHEKTNVLHMRKQRRRSALR